MTVRCLFYHLRNNFILNFCDFLRKGFVSLRRCANFRGMIKGVLTLVMVRLDVTFSVFSQNVYMKRLKAVET